MNLGKSFFRSFVTFSGIYLSLTFFFFKRIAYFVYLIFDGENQIVKSTKKTAENNLVSISLMKIKNNRKMITRINRLVNYFFNLLAS